LTIYARRRLGRTQIRRLEDLGMFRFVCVLALAVMVVSPAVAPAVSAQQASAISGVVRDPSGGVLPGVVVEASSPALIEKVRSTTSNNEGRYVIGDLVPGAYTVTFTLEGFSVVRRESFTLTSGFTAQVNADMKVGGLAETITVTAAVPLVDVSSGKRQTVVTADVLSSLPVSTKNLQTLIEITPGWTGLSDVGGQYLQEPGAFHGKRGTKVSFDGMVVENSDGNSSYQINAASVAEMAAQTSGLSAEVNADGPVMNMIPKEGGNSFNSIVTSMFTNYHLESGNLSDDLKSRGFTKVNRTYRLYDYSVSLGGPILKNKIWFFAAPRTWGVSKQLAGLYWNKTQDVFLTPAGAARKVVLWTPWVDRPLDERSGREEWYNSGFVRSTWQASERNKFSFLLDYQRACNCFGRAGGTVSQEAAGASYKFQPTRLIQARWTSARTNKLLLQAGTAFNVSQWNAYWEPNVSGDIISVLDTTLGLRYGAQSTYRGNPNYTNRYSSDFAATYVTGGHSYKFGVQNDVLATNAQYIVNGNVNYTFINGAPSAITQFSTPYLRHDRGNDFGLYFQDKWRLGRLTLGYGARLDWYYGWVPAQQTPGDPTTWPGAPQKNEWLGERSFDSVKGIPSWKDINPRVDAAYDLFGNARTALKFSIGRYVAKTNVDVPTANNPITTSVISASRSWIDTNKNYVPDCDLGNFASQDRSTSGGDVCGAINNTAFGKNNPLAARWSDQVLNGWGVRDSNIDISTEIQHQINRSLSASAGYFFNTGGYFRNSTTTTKNRATDNVLVDRTNYDPYCITAPKDPRLPNGGGYQVCGLYDINPAKFGQVQTVVTLTKNFGTPKYRNHFVDFSLDARLPHGARIGGGLDTGYSLVDTCFVIDSPQSLVNCRVVMPFKGQTQVKLNGSYPLLGGITLAGALQSLPGVPYQADYNASTAEIAPSLGRPLAGGTRTALVPLVAPNSFFEARINRLDLRISKKLNVGGRRHLQLNLDAYNALNSSAITAINSTFDARWLQPNTVIDPRLFQFSGELSF